MQSRTGPGLSPGADFARQPLYEQEIYMQGKIIKGIGGFYYVHDGVGSVVECKAKGAFRSRSLKPLVGDAVRFEITDPLSGTGRIEEILPRTNELIRPAVANMDQALILVSASTPAFHPGLLDNFLLWMAWQEVPTLIGIGKTDTDPEEHWREIAGLYRGAGFAVFPYSAVNGEGLEDIRNVLKGKTTVLAGASGVGKSTLLNALIPDAGMETGELSRKLGRGRHTTRHSEFFFMEEGSFILDTPGFTSLDTPELEAEAVRHYYPEFDEPAKGCRFPDCFHRKEPDCGVRAAVRAGQIARSRYESYLRNLEDIEGRRKY